MRVPTVLAALAAVLLLAACGSSRSHGAGSLTVTARPARASVTHTVTHTTAAHPAGTVSGAGATAHIAFARVPLRGTGHELTLPRGWHAALWAHVGDARMEAFSPEGTLLVSEPGDGAVTELAPRAGHAPSQRTIISGLTEPQGLAFDRVGGREYLYVAASDALYCYLWRADGTVTRRTTTVADLPDTKPAGDDVHRYKDVVVGAGGDLFVNVGSSSNATIPAATPRGTLPRATVIEVHPSDTPLHRATTSVYATGVRNGEGLAIAPDGSLWTAVNERDQITYPFHRAYDGHADAYGQLIPAYVDDHPPDEVARLTPGRDLGWPYCDPDPDVHPDVHPGIHNSPLSYANMPFTDDQQTNPGGSRLDCTTLTPIQRGLPAHSAPLGMSFLAGSRLPAPWRDGAVVAAHGSWDRQPPRPPVVYWMPWEARTHTLGAAITLVSGFQNPDGTRWGRVADAVPGPDGALYVTDDQSGAVYRIVP